MFEYPNNFHWKKSKDRIQNSVDSSNRKTVLDMIPPPHNSIPSNSGFPSKACTIKYSKLSAPIANFTLKANTDILFIASVSGDIAILSYSSVLPISRKVAQVLARSNASAFRSIGFLLTKPKRVSLEFLESFRSKILLCLTDDACIFSDWMYTEYFNESGVCAFRLFHEV